MGGKRQKPAKKHHVLPQFHLRNFAKDNKVWVLDFDNKKSYRTNLINAACVEGFYTVKTIYKQEDDCIEQKFLAPIESLAEPIVSRILETEHPPTIKDWGVLANFIALMYVRGPWFRQVYLETHEHLANKIASDLLSSEDLFNKTMAEVKQATGEKATDFTYKQALESREKFEITSSIARTYYVSEMMKQASRLFNVFARMTPSLLLAPFIGRGRFITSDKPIQATSRKPNPRYKNWLQDPNVELYFPLSSRICLVLNLDEYRLESPASRQKIASINDLLACECTRVLISQNQDFAWRRENGTVSYSHDELLQLLADSKKTQPIMTIGGEKPLSKCRSDWNLLRGQDPIGENDN